MQSRLSSRASLRTPRRTASRRTASRRTVARRTVPHRRRSRVEWRHPQHVVIRVQPDVPNLRTRRMFGRIHRALNAAKARFGCRIIHYSIQGNHIHLIVETENERALSRAMQGLGVRIAKGLNRVLKRCGQVLEQRYFAKSLTSELQVREAMAYLFDNDRKHDAQRGRKLRPAGTLDPYATGVHFDDWWPLENPALVAARERSRATSEVLRLDAGEASVVKPRTWLLRVGWLAGGLLPLDKVRDYSKHRDVRRGGAAA